MKRDLDLIREVMKAVEDLPFDGSGLPSEIKIADRGDIEVSYHVMLLDEAGLLKAMEQPSYGDDGMCWVPIRLTYAGHEFLDAAKDDTIWSKAKSTVIKEAGVLTLEGLKMALPLVIKQLISGAA